MLFAKDKNGIRTYIEDAIRGDSYFCPVCCAPLVQKKGKIRIDHFAHKSKCSDSWHYDMSEWHTNWQNRFPVDCQEIVKEADGFFHRADVLIEKCKTVIEFQHSKMAPDEFKERTQFYNKLGYKVIWVFDFSEEYEMDKIRISGSAEAKYLRWNRNKSTFDYIDELENVALHVFLGE